MLARTVTHSSVAEAQRQISSAEFSEWWWLYRAAPWDAEWMTAVEKAAAPRRQPAEQMEAMLMAFTQAQHGNHI